MPLMREPKPPCRINLATLLANPCLFTGQRYDTESGLYWCKTRHLEPATGRHATRNTTQDELFR